MKLVGRDRELAELRASLNVSINGMKSVRVLRGSPGAGKSAILNSFTECVPANVTVLRTEGVESEAGIGYAGLHRLLSVLLPRSASLPHPQWVALHVAFGLADGPRPDRLHIGLAALTLLADAAAETPVLCVVDDAHWLDTESLNAITFVARQLLADRVSVILAVRDTSPSEAFRGFDELVVGGLGEADAIELLSDLCSHRLEAAVASRIVSEAAGNPLVLHELARTFGVDELNRRGVQPVPLPVEAVIGSRFGDQIAGLPSDTTTLLLVLAADQRADGHLLKQAAAFLGIDVDAIDAAETAGLVNVSGERVNFRHPLVRSACYSAAGPRKRRLAHAVLAQALDPQQDLERHAWHLALASMTADEATATTLMAAARRAGARGANRSQVELLAHAAELTPDPIERSRRHLHACGAATMVSDGARVTELVERARASTTDPYLLAEVAHFEALAPVFDRQWGAAPKQLLLVAKALDDFDRDKARAVALEALFMLGDAQPGADSLTQRQWAEAVRAMPRLTTTAPTVVDLLVDGYATVIIDGWAAAAGQLKEAMRSWPDEAQTPAAVHRHLGPPLWAGFSLWDYETLDRLIASDVAVSRRAGAVHPLRSTLLYQAKLEVALGRFNRAEVTAAEAADLSLMMDGENNWKPLFAAETLAWRGQQDAVRTTVLELHDLGNAQQLGFAIDTAHLATAVLANGTRQYATAATAARAIRHTRISVFASQALAELAESLVRLDERTELDSVLAEIDSRARASGTAVARGISARVHAMALEGPDAEDLFRHAVDLLSTTAAAPDHARALLVHGEWLRRQNRRLEARQHLRDAYDRFATMGAAAFAERARSELEATGEHTRRRDIVQTELTPQEHQAATLAREGMTNKEIASALYISAATVDYHLRKVYRKLDVGSRRELKRRDF